MKKVVGDAGLLRQPPRHGFEFVTGAEFEKQMVNGDPGAADWTVVLRGTAGSEVPASKLPPESWLSPCRQMGSGEVAWDVDRYNLPRGEEVAAVLICRSGRPEGNEQGCRSSPTPGTQRCWRLCGFGMHARLVRTVT
jgi:hypothetical protein